MAKPGATGITRIIHATNYSMKGLSSAWRHEAAFRQELLLIVLLMPLAFFVGDSLNQILLLMVISWLVVIVEILMLNAIVWGALTGRNLLAWW